MARIIIVAILCIFLPAVLCHNYLTNPTSRGDQKNTQTGCRYGGEGNPTCGGPCDRPAGTSVNGPITVSRGQTIPVTWYRHTHPGGFIRFAWSPTVDSNSHESFNTYVDRYVCKETGGCGPLDNTSPPEYSTNGVDCGYTLTVPGWLPDGAWTLQWAYFGGWFNAGDYYACVDYTVSGGATSTQPVPLFYGGDYTYPGQAACAFYSTNALRVCTVEPCTNGTYTGGVQQRGTPSIYSAGTYTPVTIAGSSPAVTTGAPVATTAAPPQQVTTSPAPITSGKVTSGRSTTSAVTSSAVTSSVFVLTSGTASGGEIISGIDSNSDSPIPCTSNAGCESGICEVSGYCYNKKSKLGAGGIAAIVFAMLVVVVVVGGVVFFYVNKKEIPFMKPFKGHL